MTDAELAAKIAEAAGNILMSIRDSDLMQGRALGIAGDKIANHFILDVLRAERPGDAILSEESIDTTERLTHERVWIIDPLDGTREYCEGRADWAVHVALSVRGRPSVGAVALPAQGRLLRSDAPPAIPEPSSEPIRLLVSRTRPPAEAGRVVDALGAELVPMGSAGAKAMAVLTGLGDVYLHAGGQYEWDNCAPAAVALSAGLNATRLDGAALEYNRPDPRLPDLLICRPALAERVKAALA